MIDVFLGFAFLASATVANKYALSALSLSLMVGLRMLGAGIILLSMYRKTSHRLSFTYFKEDLPILIGISLLTMLIPALFKAYALKNMLTSKAALLASLDPFVTALYSYLFWGERLTKKKLLGIILGFSGTAILLISSSPAEAPLRAWFIFSYAEIAALLAMGIGRIGWMLVQQLLRKNRYTPPEANGLLMTISGFLAFALPFCWAFCSIILQKIPVLGLHVSSYTFAQASALLAVKTSSQVSIVLIFCAVIYTIIMGNVVGYTMYAQFLKRHSSTFVSLSGFSVPLFVYIISYFLLGEPLNINFIYASAITFIGLLIFYQDEIHNINQDFLYPFTFLKKILLQKD